uniref:Potassium/proton antiporter CemA n=1 Tax=Pseudochlorella signiensis TaxID=173497 RepID=A0A097KKT5_9CHLO|nr:chloroplast enveloppe membrane protein [Pseudochlorella signiensis]AIT93804.1 chloroplast enveloppe membrane protein [Pseudochlorella signiensis]
MAKQAIEQTGLIPRSIIRTFDRFRKQLLPGAEKLVIQEFRISRFQVLVSVKCLVSLTIIPLIINYLLKNFLLIPVTENFWNRHQNEIFLNSYQQDRAFTEIKKFEEKIYFEFLINDLDNNFIFESDKSDQENTTLGESNKIKYSLNSNFKELSEKDLAKKQTTEEIKELYFESTMQKRKKIQLIESKNVIQEDLQEKIIELAIHYNQQSIIALTNLFGDFITFGIISFLVIWMKPQIIILKSFLTESIYSLSDTTKSFLLILGTDLLVGFHSPRGWEIFLELILRHFGFPENQDFIYLFVATFPVLLDTVFKYWIFRYLNQISPSTVATYHSMIE